MITWEKCNKVITLPTKDKINNYTIPASDDYIDIWNNGPKSQQSKDIANAIQKLALVWCQLIKKYQGKVNIFTKQAPHDLVTDMDIGIESLITTWIRKWLPKHRIIGEEKKKDTLKPTDYIWYIDPIDGTNNYTKNSTQVTLQIACVYQHAPFCSFIGLPIMNEWVYGYYENGSPIIKKSPHFNKCQKSTSSPVVCTEYIKTNKQKLAQKIAQELQAELVTYQSIGCSILHLLNYDGVFYINQAKLWDVIPPLAILFFENPYKWFFHIAYTPLQGTTVTEHSIFSTIPSFISFINHCHQSHCRIGFSYACPTNHQTWQAALHAIYQSE